MIIDYLRVIVGLFMVVAGMAIVLDRTRKSYSPLAFAIVASGIDLLYWKIYTHPLGFLGWVRVIYLGFVTLLWIAVGIQMWSLTIKYRENAKDQKQKRTRNRLRSLHDIGGTEDPPTDIPAFFNDD